MRTQRIIKISSEDITWLLHDYLDPKPSDDDYLLRVKALLRSLSDIDKLIFILRMENYSYEVISAYLGHSFTFTYYRYKNILCKLSSLGSR